ncbi:MAG: hypothetical protein IT374_26095 [Polyangiaceae bacterium]|nr:hypothetical protein [Polyangiaceae bacterium]
MVPRVATVLAPRTQTTLDLALAPGLVAAEPGTRPQLPALDRGQVRGDHADRERCLAQAKIERHAEVVQARPARLVVGGEERRP